MTSEKMINVPLDEETKAALETSARENGRAVGREAAMLVKRELASFRRGLKEAAKRNPARWPRAHRRTRSSSSGPSGTASRSFSRSSSQR